MCCFYSGWLRLAAVWPDLDCTSPISNPDVRTTAATIYISLQRLPYLQYPHLNHLNTSYHYSLLLLLYCLLHSSRILPYIHNLYKCCQCRNHLHFHMITKCVFSVGNNTMPVSSVVDSCRFYTILQSLFYRFAPPRKVQFVNYSRTQNNRAAFCRDGWLAGTGGQGVQQCLHVLIMYLLHLWSRPCPWSVPSYTFPYPHCGGTISSRSDRISSPYTCSNCNIRQTAWPQGYGSPYVYEKSYG